MNRREFIASALIIKKGQREEIQFLKNQYI